MEEDRHPEPSQESAERDAKLAITASTTKDHVMEFHGQIVDIISMLDVVRPNTREDRSLALSPNHLDNAVNYLSLARDELTSSLEAWLVEEKKKLEKVQECVSQVRAVISTQIDKFGGVLSTPSEVSAGVDIYRSQSKVRDDIARKESAPIVIKKRHQDVSEFYAAGSSVGPVGKKKYSKNRSGQVKLTRLREVSPKRSVGDTTAFLFPPSTHSPVFVNQISVRRNMNTEIFSPQESTTSYESMSYAHQTTPTLSSRFVHLPPMSFDVLSTDTEGSTTDDDGFHDKQEGDDKRHQDFVMHHDELGLMSDTDSQMSDSTESNSSSPADLSPQLRHWNPTSTLHQLLHKAGLKPTFEMVHKLKGSRPTEHASAYTYRCCVGDLAVEAGGRSRSVAKIRVALSMIRVIAENQMAGTLPSNIVPFTAEEMEEIGPLLKSRVLSNSVNTLRRECRRRELRMPTFKKISTKGPNGEHLITVQCSALGLMLSASGRISDEQDVTPLWSF